MTIGEFARRSGLSLKALRLYDARGLLEPVRVDPDSGYRYYDLGQLDRAHTISLLRRLEMPLGTIADVLAASNGQAAAIRSWWDGRQRELTERGPELDLVLHVLGEPDAPARTGRFGVDDVVVEAMGPRTVASVRHHVLQEDLVASLTSDVVELRAFLDAGGATYGPEFWVLFHGAVGFDGDGPIETCVPYEGADRACRRRHAAGGARADRGARPGDGRRLPVPRDHRRVRRAGDLVRVPRPRARWPGARDLPRAVVGRGRRRARRPAGLLTLPLGQAPGWPHA